MSVVAVGLLGLALILAIASWRVLRQGLEHGLFSYCAVVCAVLWAGVVLWCQPPRTLNAAKRSHCLSNLKQHSVALIMYASDHDDHWPAKNWWTATYEYRKNNSLVCPILREDDGIGYGINDRLQGAQTSKIDTDKTLLLSETLDHKANATMHSEADLERRHRPDEIIFSRLDGSASVNRENSIGRGEQWSANELVAWQDVRSMVDQYPNPNDLQDLWGRQLQLLGIASLLCFAGSILGMILARKERKRFWFHLFLAIALCVLIFVFIPVHASAR